MKKLLSIIIAVSMILAVAVMTTSAAEPLGDMISILDHDFVTYYEECGEDESSDYTFNGKEYKLYDIDALNGYCSRSRFGHELGAGHLFNYEGIMIGTGSIVVVRFKGTGATVGGSYRCPARDENGGGAGTASRVRVFLDGVDVTETAVDWDNLNSASEHDTTRVEEVIVKDLEDTDHELVLENLDLYPDIVMYWWTLDHITIAGYTAPVDLTEDAITLKKVQLDGEKVIWTFTGLIEEPRYEAGWQLQDDEGNFYQVSGWAWDDSKGYTVLTTDCENYDAAYAKAEEGKLTAAIIDVTPDQGNKVVDASDSPTKILGEDDEVVILDGTQLWGDGHDAATAVCKIKKVETEAPADDTTAAPADDTTAAPADDTTADDGEDDKGASLGLIIGIAAAVIVIAVVLAIVLGKKKK